VGIARTRIANTQEDGHLALIPELLQGRHGGMEAQRIIDGDDLVRRDAQVAAIIPVQAVSIRNHRIQSVVAPREGQHCKDVLFRHDSFLRLA
jgi:hypothetical protein